MANAPTVGIFLPGGSLNTFNSSAASGQVDAYGLTYPTASTRGKMIELGANEAANLTAPNTTYPMLDGAYQIVQLDSGANATYATQGLAAYIKLDSGATAGALPETDFVVPIVTDYTHKDNAGLCAGVFLNQATLNGQSNAPTPGNYTLIWVGAGRCYVNYDSTFANNSPALGDLINAGGSNGTFTDSSASAYGPNTVGKAVTTPAVSTTGVIYASDIFYRLVP